ncbi:MAG TPA: acyl-CoA thioesterase II [Acidimicrobiaceae bacterium]|nr:acyl-CoA thioesterase II [Acidimicrobiaceae bacterium]
MSDVFKDLMEIKSLGNNEFIAPAAPEGGPRTFGGQLLAHTLRAAQLSVDAEKSVHSSHSYFLRPGDVDALTELRVEEVRDGRSFSVRQVVAYQSGLELFRSTLSFQITEDGLEWSPEAYFDVPGPDKKIMSYYDYWESQSVESIGPWHGRSRPMDILYINPPDLPEGISITEPQLMWIRINEPIGEDRRLQEAALAYIADATLVDHVLLPHGYRWQDDRLTGASLDHSMWFHRQANADDWLLYEQRVETTGGSRGLASGRFFNVSGELVATCMQEGLIRWGH